jgi:hypothetical protein
VQCAEGTDGNARADDRDRPSVARHEPSRSASLVAVGPLIVTVPRGRAHDEALELVMSAPAESWAAFRLVPGPIEDGRSVWVLNRDVIAGKPCG